MNYRAIAAMAPVATVSARYTSRSPMHALQHRADFWARSNEQIADEVRVLAHHRPIPGRLSRQY